MVRTSTSVVAHLAALLAATAMPVAVHAQDQSGTAGQTAQTYGFGDIIVTADRRATSIQDVPLSITAVTGDSLVRAGIQNTEGLVNATPGLIVQRSVVGKISIRGVGNENYTISGDPGVAVHSDGVYVARASAGLFDLFDIDRVEVLRGPQGTLYGRNATGGVINIIPSTPSEVLEASVRAEYGNYDKLRLEGAVSGPVIEDKLLVRLAALGAWRDGFTDNIFPGAEARGLGDLDNQDLFAVRGQIELRATETFSARLAVEYLGDDSNLPPYKYLNQPDALPDENYRLGDLRTVSQGFELQIPGASRGVGDDDDVFKTNQLGVALHIDADLGPVTAKSITGYRETSFNWVNDGDGADIFYVNYIQQDDTDQFSQELQFASNGGGSFSWLAGAYYFEESGDTFIALPFTFGAGLPFYIEINGEAKTKAWAGFGEVKWQATDQLAVTLGGRYAWEKREVMYDYEINFGAPTIVPGDEEATFKRFTPRVVVNYAASPDFNLYASATNGFKSGGFNLLAIQPGFEPEKVWNFEAGVKSTLADGLVVLNANVFYADYKDMQVGQVVNLSATITNAGAATLYGAEMELRARPSDNFNLGATLAFLETEYDNFCTGDPTQPAAVADPTCDTANPIQLAGNTLPRAPKLALTADATYTVGLPGGSSIDLRADVRYQSKTYFTQFNRDLVSQDGYAVANGRITWFSADDRFNFGVWMNNIFDKTYFSEVLESGAFNPQLVAQGYVAPPRTYGISAGFNF